MDNIDYLKEVILNSDTSLYEKYDAYMRIKLQNKDILLLTKKIIENLELENDMHIIILSEICTYAITNAFVDLIPMLSQLSQNSVLIKNKSSIVNELENTIKILEQFKEKSYQTNSFFKKPENTTYKLMKTNKGIPHVENDDEMFLQKNAPDEEDNDEFNVAEMN